MGEIEFLEGKCFAITSGDLLKIMKSRMGDKSLTFEMDEDTREVYIHSHERDIDYTEDDIIECVREELGGIELNNMFAQGNKYWATVYFTALDILQKDK